MATKLCLTPVNARRGCPADIYRLPAGRYWVSGVNGENIEISISDGPSGVGIRVKGFNGSLPFVETERFAWGKEDPPAQNDGFTEISVCQYRPDPRSQAFSRWYRNQETEADIAILGEEYRRKA